MARSWKNNPWSIPPRAKESSGQTLKDIKVKMKRSLVMGKHYHLRKKQMKLIGIYPNFATFEKNGIKESFSYQELYRMLHAN